MAYQEDVSHDKGVRLVKLLLLLLPGPMTRKALLAALSDLYGKSPTVAFRRDLQTLQAALPPGARLILRNRRSEVSLEGLGRLVPPATSMIRSTVPDGKTITIDMADTGAVQALLARLRSGSADSGPPMLRVEMDLASGYGEHAATVAALERALRSHQSVMFTYKAAGQEPRQHERVELQQLVLRDGHLYVDAYDKQREQHRGYRVDRIMPGSVVMLPFYQGEPRASKGVPVRLRLLPPLSSGDISRRLEEQRIIDQLPDGSAIIEGRARSLFEARRLVLGYGALAEALEPAVLRQQLADDTRAMAAIYAAASTETAER
jgi:predicted DNA-binding transcriptional regulator YafY